MNARDIVRLRHMRDEAMTVLQFIHGRSQADLDQDKLFSYGLRYALQIVGEAAAQVSSETRTLYPEIRWGEIVGMRQWLVHGYERVKNEVIWRTATEVYLPS